MTDDDIDPAARPTRRTFSAEYKAEIVAEYDSHPKGSEERGAILRREGLYTSHISKWRKQAEAAPGLTGCIPRVIRASCHECGSRSAGIPGAARAAGVLMGIA